MEGTQSAMPPGMEGVQRHAAPRGKDGIEGEVPEGEARGEFFEVIIGACAGGAFIDVFAAAPPAITGFAATSGIGCGLGVVTVTVNLAAIFAYREIAG
jgi:hypothetical protein